MQSKTFAPEPLILPTISVRPASNRSEVADPTGAGDTVAATFTLALVVGATMAEAALLANIAAGLVVRRIGCATNTPDELSAAVTALVQG